MAPSEHCVKVQILDSGIAQDWIRGSLAQGSLLSMVMTERLPALLVAVLMIPRYTDPGARLRLDNHGRGYSPTEVDRVAAQFFHALAACGAQTLVVEDDLARRGDQHLTGDVAFVDGRVIRWTVLEEGSNAAAVRLLRTGSSGYPLNAFVSILARQ